MNETINSIMQRNSCRDFAATPLTEQQIKALVEAALAAPSARNLQPWHVSVVTDKKLIEEMDTAGMEVLAADEDKSDYNLIMERGGKLLYNAPCIIVISSDGSKWGQMDSGILCQNIAIAAQSMGLANCIVGFLRVPLSGPRGKEFIERMKFPQGNEFAVSILVGTANKSKTPHPLDFNKVSYI